MGRAPLLTLFGVLNGVWLTDMGWGVWGREIREKQLIRISPTGSEADPKAKTSKPFRKSAVIPARPDSPDRETCWSCGAAEQAWRLRRKTGRMLPWKRPWPPPSPRWVVTRPTCWSGRWSCSSCGKPPCFWAWGTKERAGPRRPAQGGCYPGSRTRLSGWIHPVLVFQRCETVLLPVSFCPLLGIHNFFGKIEKTRCSRPSERFHALTHRSPGPGSCKCRCYRDEVR